MDINNISPYIPTQYVDYSTPDINAVNLNKAEVALQRVTAAANEAINAIKELNAAKIDTAKIVTSLASTDTLSVLSGAIGPVIDQRLTDLLNKYNQLNGDIITGVDRFPPANTGTQEITVNFPEPMRGAPKVFAMWEDTTITLTYVDKLVITGATSSGFKIATNRLKPSENWWFCYIAIYNR